MEISKPSTPLSIVGRPPLRNANVHHHKTTLVSVDPITLAINECMIMASAMRKLNRWAQSGAAALFSSGDIFGDDDEQEEGHAEEDEEDEGAEGEQNGSSNNLGVKPSNLDRTNANTNIAVSSRKPSTTQGNPLLASFLQLKSILIDTKNIYDIDSLTLLQPFLMVIKSSSTSGYITELALNTISKFLNYDIISFKSKNLQTSLIQIISSLTHCRFEAADQNSDDAVLLKVLRLLERIIEDELSRLLPNDVVSEVVQTCLSLACNKKRSEVLRRAAEMSMDSMTVEIFSKLKDIDPELDNGDDLQTNFSDTILPEDRIGGTDVPTEINSPRNLISGRENILVDEIHEIKSEEKHQEPKDTRQEDDQQLKVQPVEDETKDMIEVQNEKQENPPIENIPSSSSLKEKTEFDVYSNEEPYGIICINEFLGILVSMISPSNQYQHMESTRVFALSLINTAIEVAGVEIPKHPSLLNLVTDPISKHVLLIITTTESPALLRASLKLFTTITIVLDQHCKPQFELSISLIFQSILPQSEIQMKGSSQMSFRNPISKEILIESLSLLWIRSPSFFTNLFIDYDCDFEKSDLAINILQYLCRLSLPESAFMTTDNVPPLCLEGVLSFISGINERSKKFKETKQKNDLVEKRKQKIAFIKCTELFNENPKLGVKQLATDGFIKDGNDLKEIANFFFSKSGRLNKKVLGEFLAKPSNSELFGHFIDLFDFHDMRVDEALRVLLKTFRLPGESQQIERVVERFAERYVECQGQDHINPDKSTIENNINEAVYPDKDSVFILSYSIIMLNTDLHNPQVKKQMALDEYRRNLRGVYNGQDFPEWYLSKIYFSIKSREIIMPEEHHGTDKWFDDIWNNIVVTTQSSIPKFSDIKIEEVDKVLLSLVFPQIISTIFHIFHHAREDQVITTLIGYVYKLTQICLKFELHSEIRKIIDKLIKFTTLTHTPKNLNEILITEVKLDNKTEIYVSDYACSFGRDFKAQLSTVVLFKIIKKNNLKLKNWDKIVEIIERLYQYSLIIDEKDTTTTTTTNDNKEGDDEKDNKEATVETDNSILKLLPSKDIKKFPIKRITNDLFLSILKNLIDNQPTEEEIQSTLAAMDCIKSLDILNVLRIVAESKKQAN